MIVIVMIVIKDSGGGDFGAINNNIKNIIYLLSWITLFHFLNDNDDNDNDDMGDDFFLH